MCKKVIKFIEESKRILPDDPYLIIICMTVNS